MYKCKITLLGGLLFLTIANANVVNITDTTTGTAVVDGTINVGEYVGSGTGINGGFGDVWGSGSSLFVDSSDAGVLNFGFRKGTGSFNDVAVIYIDSVTGGSTSTVPLNDNADPGRAAISGDGTATGFSDLNFASGFGADYAIAWESGGANLFQIVESGSHTFITSLSVSNSGNDYEGSITLANIGLTVGDSFNYFSTYLNASNAFRSDEFHGVESFGGGNPGTGTTGISTFNTFTSIPEPSSILMLGLTGLAAGGLALIKRRKRS